MCALPIFCPDVADDILLSRRQTLDRGFMEVDLACALPSGLLRSHPAFVRCRVLALIDSRCRALNNKQLLRVPSQMRDGLNGRRAGSDNGHPLVRELAQYRSLLDPKRVG